MPGRRSRNARVGPYAWSARWSARRERGLRVTAEDLLRDALADPANAAILHILPGLRLPQCHLTAGCLFQAVWNRVSGQSPGWGVKDYDIFYFDRAALSWAAEDAVIRRVAEATAGLGATIEVKNQARVHLWYRERFGSDYPVLASAQEGIDRYLVACTCVGVEVATRSVYAPHGFDDMEAGILRMTPLADRPDLFRAKAESYRARWPWLQVMELDDPST